jgi:hypothetical protein
MAPSEFDSNDTGREDGDSRKPMASTGREKPKRKRRPIAAGERTESRERRRATAQPRSSINFIRPAKSQDKLQESAAPAASAAGEIESSNTLRPALDSESVPQHFRERYVQDGRNWLLPSGEVAIVDHGLRLSTQSENKTIIQDMVAAAKARRWNEVVIGGTKDFNKEAWRAAKLAGLEVIGYTPSRAEQALLIQALTRGGTDRPASRERPESQPEALTHHGEQLPRQGAPAALGERATAPEDSTLILGKLLEHGADRYLHDPEEDLSYFVRIKVGRDKEREIWGVDLERAIRQSLTDVQIGDDIGLRAIERKTFPLKTHRRDETGQRVATEVEAHRNGWVVEQRRFFSDRAVLAKIFADATIRPSEGYRRHPELKGSYLELQAAKLRFEASVKNPDDQTKFLAQLRARMAASMERGEALTPVRMRERASHQDTHQKTATIPDPEHLRTR